MRAELKSLSPEVARIVAAHLVAAGQLIDDDPELAYRHAEAARRRAARLPVVREATAEAAYAAGLHEAALAQFRVLRRMTGSPDFLPVMADCLRALGKSRQALDLVEEGLAEIQDPAMAVEIRIVQAGARADLGQGEEASRLLRQLIERPPARTPQPALARAWYAWADQELAAGRQDEARHGFARAVKLDPSGQTDALDRLDALDGFVLELDEDALEDETESAELGDGAGDGAEVGRPDAVEAGPTGRGGRGRETGETDAAPADGGGGSEAPADPEDGGETDVVESDVVESDTAQLDAAEAGADDGAAEAVAADSDQRPGVD
jgi:tetratricopeptide (TPR) repeat protein